jgi:DNA-binding beta-propeller fold protein YncE
VLREHHNSVAHWYLPSTGPESSILKKEHRVMNNYNIKNLLPGRAGGLFVSVVLLTLSIFLPANAQVLDGPDPAQMEDAPHLGYRAVEHGLKIPADVEMGAPSSVVWTSQNRLLVFNRGPNANGEFVRSWGQGEYLRPHGMRLDPDGNIWVTDVNNHVVRKMNLAGEVLLTIGTPGQAGEPEDGLLNEPTDLTVNPAGEIFLLAGHGRGTPQVLKFDSAGKLMMKWGGPGTGPGQFDTPHSIVVDQEGLIYVADRQNRRIQIFDDQGTYQKEWGYKGLPCGLHFTEDHQLYMVSGFSGEILRLDANGKAIGAAGQPGKGLGEFGEAHYMTITPNGVIFIADTIRPALHKYIKI